jgi:nitrite reductase/ring-hydroxylating ferredoxin subunit
VEFKVADQSIIVVRESDTQIRGFFNACRHRGTRLVRSRGNVSHFRCPFHAWQYGLDGASRYVHDRGDFRQLTRDDLCLRQCQVGQWAGWVFINLDAVPAPDVEDYLAPLPERLRILKIEDMRYVWHKTVPLPCNWKTALDAFSESYHVPGTHPQLLRPLDHGLEPATLRELVDDPSFAPSQVLGQNVSRFLIQPRDPKRPRYASKAALESITEYHLRELRALHTQRDLAAIKDLKEEPAPNGEPISVALRALVRERAIAAGLDWPDIPPGTLRQMEGNYVVFPNMIFLVRQGVLLGYRAMPHASDPDACIFDAYALELFPAGEAPEFRPEAFDDWRDGDVGKILEQDFNNVEDVTVGLHSSSFDGATLSPVQEVSIFQRHILLDEFIFGANS